MPFLDEKLIPLDLSARVDRPKNFAVTPGAADLDDPNPTSKPAWNWDSAFRRNSEIGAYNASESVGVGNEPDPGFNPWDRIKGTPLEARWSRFAEARNPARFEAVARDIQRETEDQKALDSGGWRSMISASASGLVSPTTFLPGGSLIKGASGGVSLLRTAASVGLANAGAAAIQEGVLHSIEQTRTMGESAEAVGASLVLGGLLGGGGAALLRRGEWDGALARLNHEISEGQALPVRVSDLDGQPHANLVGGQPGSAGAMATPRASLEDNTIAGAVAEKVASATQSLNPNLRLQNSPSSVVREVANGLFDNPLYLRQNMEGRTSGLGVESMMGTWRGGLITALQKTEGGFLDARKAGYSGTQEEFRNAVGRAMRRGDEDTQPQVAAVAKAFRSDVVEPLKEAAIKAGLLEPDVSVSEAASYFSRMWNSNRITKEEPRFKDIVARHFSEKLTGEFAQAQENLSGRLGRLDREAADLQLSPEQRARALQEFDAQEQTLATQVGPETLERVDRLTELRSAQRKAKDAGDQAGEVQAREAIKQVEAQGGEELATYRKLRAGIRQRRSTVSLNAAGLADRADRVLEQLADLEESNFRSMGRLVRKGELLGQDLQRLDPEALADRISGLRDGFEAQAKRADASADRAQKSIDRIKAEAEKRLAKEVETSQRAATEAATGAPEERAGKLGEAKAARERALDVQAQRDAKLAERLEKEVATQRARAEDLNGISDRLARAERFDRQGALDEVLAGVERLKAEVSGASLKRGERAVRLQERLKELDPKRVADRLASVAEMKKSLERRFYDTWEIKRGGEGVDARAPNPDVDFLAMGREIADHVTDSLTRRGGDGSVRPEVLKVGTRGPLKERTFHIPDALVEDFLESDVQKVMGRYTRVMGAEVEMKNRFGSVDMKDQIQAIREQYREMREAVGGDEKKLKALARREVEDLRDLTAVRDLLRGTHGGGDDQSNWSTITRMVNSFNYIRQMGQVTLSSLPDAIRPAMVHGLGEFVGFTGQLLTNLKSIKMAQREAQLAGTIGERVLSHRMGTIAELADPYASRGPIENFLTKMTDTASTWNGIRLWTDLQKTQAAVMTQNRMIRGIADYDGIKPRERAYLAYLGIDAGRADRIKAQLDAHSEMVDGVRSANTSDWTDPLAVRDFRAALLKDVNRTIVEKGVSDVPLFAHSATGRVMLQFKTFNLAAHQRVMLAGLQESQARFLGGLIASSAMGMAIVYMKAVAGNRMEKLESLAENPGWWLGEGLDASGVLPLLFEGGNSIEKLSTLTGKKINPVKAPLTMFDKGTEESVKVSGAGALSGFLGPTAGLAEDVLRTTGAGVQAVAGDEPLAQGQRGAIKRLLPFNTYLGMHSLLRYTLDRPD